MTTNANECEKKVVELAGKIVAARKRGQDTTGLDAEYRRMKALLRKLQG